MRLGFLMLAPKGLDIGKGHLLSDSDVSLRIFI